MKRRKLSRSQKKLSVDEPKPSFTVEVQQIEPWMTYRCPFCLGEYPSYRFEVHLKSGKKSGKGICPECGQHFLWKTLVSDMTPVQYAEWLYSYMGYGGYQKVSWEKLKLRLKQMGIANTFWEAWKAAKNKAYEESGRMSEDEIERQYKEYEQSQSASD